MTPPQRRPRSALLTTGLAGVGAGVAGCSHDGGRPHGQPAWARAPPGPLGSETLTSRCGLVVLANQAAEPVPPPDRTDERGSTSAGLAVDTPRRAKRQASVRSLVLACRKLLVTAGIGGACDLPVRPGITTRAGCTPGRQGSAPLPSPTAAAGECSTSAGGVGGAAIGVAGVAGVSGVPANGVAIGSHSGDPTAASDPATGR